MGTVKKGAFILLVAVMGISLLPGCTNWEKKYKALEVEHQNTLGLLEREKGEKGQLAEKVSQNEQLIADLQKKIAEKKSAAEATGFGAGYDVAFDAAAGTITVTLPDTILFDSGKANLKKAVSDELNHIQSVLSSKYSGRLVDVIGHTDTDPIQKSKWRDNWELSAERALSVVRYLIDRGIRPEKIRAIGRGESQPIAPNDTVSGKAKNRRVEIVVHIK
jgi:chemotaxis protein MotB